MRVAVITSSSTYETRAFMIADFFERSGLDVSIVLSDFRHREKVKRQISKTGRIYINTIPYYKNMSFKRLYSHYDYSRKVYQLLQKEKFNILYVLIPANSLAKFVMKYAKGSETVVILDIIDLWPESLPLGHLKLFWPVSIWAGLRDKNLRDAALVITECDLYRKILKLEKKNINSATVYWPKNGSIRCSQFVGNTEQIEICYLGSINNIIDIPAIVKLLGEVNRTKSVHFHIIGDGEKKDLLLEEAERKGIHTIYHGAVYDDDEKRALLSRCMFGLNIMKPSVCVGLTMKAVDYMFMGIPMINNIQGDTWELIHNYYIGINYRIDETEEIAKQILEQAEMIQEKRPLIQKIYQEKFSEAAFQKEMEKQLLPIIKGLIDRN